MGEFDKDRGGSDQPGQQADKPVFGQLDKEQDPQGEEPGHGAQDQEELAGAEGGKEGSGDVGQQGDFGAKGGQQQGQDGAQQQADNQTPDFPG